MIDADTTINERFTVEEFEQQYENTDFTPADPSKDHFFCDFCSKGIAYSEEPHVGHYMADNIINHQHPKAPLIRREKPLVALATYCTECTSRRLLFPCKGFTELRVTFRVGNDRVMRDVAVQDLSPSDDGIPWDPREITEKITGQPLSGSAFMSVSEHLWGPENAVTFFESAVDGVDIREMVKWDGSIDPQVLGRARKSFEEHRKKMRANEYDRKAFRDSVRGEE